MGLLSLTLGDGYEEICLLAICETELTFLSFYVCISSPLEMKSKADNRA